MSSSITSGNGNGNGAEKFTLFTAGLHNKILIDSIEQQHNMSPPKQISARSKLSHPPHPVTSSSSAGGNKQKPKRPSSANPRVRSSHQHREPGKPQKNHPILNNPNHNAPPAVARKELHEYDGRNFSVLNREELLEALTEIKKQQRNNETIIAQLRADNQRLESEVLKQQHRIDKLLSPQFAKNSHLLLEIRKEIEKSVLVRQLKAQMLSLRGTITDKEMIIESLQKKTGSAHLIELSAEKEEYFHEIQRLKKMLTQKEKELQQEKNSHAWQKKGENVTLEDNLKAEITRLSRGYQQVLERLETTTAATNASKLHQSRVDETDNHSAKPSSSRPSSGKSRRPKSAGSKASTSKTNSALDYLDPILTTFDPPKSNTTTAAPAPATHVNLTTNAANIPTLSRPKEPDFLYEMSEENLVGVGGESSVEAYLVTNKGLNIPTDTPLPMGCKIEVQKPGDIRLEGRICGYSAERNLYDVQYDEGGKEFDVSRAVILVLGERPSQQEQQQQQPNGEEPSPRRQLFVNSAPTHSFSAKETATAVSISIKSLSANGLRHVEYLDGENDPYAILSYGTWRMSTSVQVEGGSDVMWEFHSSEGFEFQATPEMIKNIPFRVEVFDKNTTLKDTLIGAGEGSLQPAAAAFQHPSGTEIRVNIPLTNLQGRSAGTVILSYAVVLSSQGHLGQGQGQGQGQGKGKGSPRKENEMVSKYQVGDKVEGNYQMGGSWYPGIILTINGGKKYRVRYRDGDEEGNVLEENIRYPSQKNSSSSSQQIKPSQQQQQQQPESPATSSSPRVYLPDDRVECCVSGKNEIAIIQKVNMDGTYDLLLFAGEGGGSSNTSQTHRNVPSSSIIRGLQPGELSWPIPQPQESNGQESHNDSPTNHDDPLYAIGNRVETNYRCRGKWYPGTVSDVRNHGESYRIDYDDGEIEEGVVSKNIRLREVVAYNIDSLLNDDDDEEEGNGEGQGIAGLTTRDLLDDNYFQQLQSNNNEREEEEEHQQQQQEQLAPSSLSSMPRKQPSVDINSFLEGLSDDDEGGDVIGGNLDGGDSINLDYGVCATAGDADGAPEEDGGDYGDDFDD